MVERPTREPTRNTDTAADIGMLNRAVWTLTLPDRRLKASASIHRGSARDLGHRHSL